MSKFIMVIFGGSGDLTKRKLIPALFDLFCKKRLSQDFNIVGVGRTSYDDLSFQSYMKEQMSVYIPNAEPNLVDEFVSHLNFVSMSMSEAKNYTLLNDKIETLSGSKDFDNMLYYLATPPSLYGVIPLHLKTIGLNRKHSRIVVEKPFGSNLQESIELNDIYDSVFDESQVYRIDHFLGKETAQNILAFRFANSIFEPIWNKDHISHVEITAVENMGIEFRGGYYENSGALRDMVQNHLIQLLALAAMEAPAHFNEKEFRDNIINVYNSLVPLDDDYMRDNLVRGQYASNELEKAYREEKDVYHLSRTETFVALKVLIDNDRWKDVPFFIRTGKQMPTKVSEIVVHFKKTNCPLFGCGSQKCNEHNKLVIRLQPHEGISLKFMAKTPGNEFKVQNVSMDFSFDNIREVEFTDAYAKLIEDCILGDPTLFMRSDAVVAAWTYFNPILKYWEENEQVPLYAYPAKTWGPIESVALISPYAENWSNPCKNLTDTNYYCEL